MEYNGVLGEEMGQKSVHFLQALTSSPKENDAKNYTTEK